ncbi:MAG: peptidylprolyl isomerase [Burkholderiaceae bacterium]|nr:peptidylprolyl isomerase [Burkholderiaceae bacterium]
MHQLRFFPVLILVAALGCTGAVLAQEATGSASSTTASAAERASARKSAGKMASKKAQTKRTRRTPDAPIAATTTAAAASSDSDQNQDVRDDAADLARHSSADYIVAVVNSEPITNTEVRINMQRALANPTNTEVRGMSRAQLQKAALEHLIFQKAQLEQAKENGITVDDLAVDQAERMVALQNNISLEEMHQRLAADNIALKDFRRDLRNQITIQRLRDAEVAPRVKVTDLEVEQYLQSPQGQQIANTVVPQTHVRHILLLVNDKRSTQQSVALLNDFKKRLQAGTADFDNLARDYSQDPTSAAKGGDLGWSRPGMFVPEFEQVMNQLQDDQISEPIITRYGVHLIQVLDRRESTLSSEEVREGIRAQLHEKQLEEAYNTWARELRDSAYVEYRDPPQ